MADAKGQDGLSHVDVLIEKYRHGRSIAKIERDAGLKAGALSAHLKPSARGKSTSVEIIDRFKNALGAPLLEVSQAFFADAGVQLIPGSPLTPQAALLLLAYSRLGDDRQRIALRLVEALAADQADTERPIPADSIAPEISVTPNT
ncbi:hypothetical protein JOD54_001411 [Actinokineospora baliensis]|uniref:hypothetical protein n=1 Tax=Actinokineospora baliensis TaxID=547056 RepID=UPI00195C1EB6|nr:hypothetical protein [Actinokineospora baliensis]MBM7771207.1 hypothetical protein [Actinokineospora baliensis]